MGAMAFLWIAIPVAISCLSGWAFVMLNPPHEKFIAVRVCFWLSAILWWIMGAMWGVFDNHHFVIRALIVGAIGATGAIGLMEGLRAVGLREAAVAPAADAAPPAPGSAPSGGQVINGPNQGQVAGIINNNGPVHIGPTTIHRHTVVHENSNEGILEPANDPDPASIKKSPGPIPADALKVIMGTSVFWSTHFPRTILMMIGEPMIQVARSANGRNLTVTVLRIFDDRDNIIARIDADGFWVENSTRKKRPDKSTFVVFDHNDQEVLRMRFMNRHTISVRGVFRQKGVPFPVVSTDEYLDTGFGRMVGGGAGGGGPEGADVAIKTR